MHQKVLSNKEVEAGILEDAVVQFTNKCPGGQHRNHYYGKGLRRIAVDRSDQDRLLTLVTNDFSRCATEIAQLYKKRWGIELFFKWLKQNLKIKKFLGRSENAVRIQIYTALLTYLLAYISHQKEKSRHSLKLWLVQLKTGLFQRPESEQITAHKRRREHKEFADTQGALAL